MQTVHGTVQVMLSAEHGVKLEHDSNEAAQIPPEPELNARHSQSELVEQGADRVAHDDGWH